MGNNDNPYKPNENRKTIKENPKAGAHDAPYIESPVKRRKKKVSK